MNYMEEAFAPAEARNRAIVLSNTFGHLAPEPARSYQGWIVFAHTTYGDLVPIDTEFDGLPDSPWFFDDMLEYIESVPSEPGSVYRFVGTYKRFKNGRCRFSGNLASLLLPERGSRTLRDVESDAGTGEGGNRRMTIWYKTGWGIEIAEVEVVRETEQWLFMNRGRSEPRRTNKRSNYENYFRTIEEAVAFLQDCAARKLASAKQAYELAQKQCGAVQDASAIPVKRLSETVQ